MKAPYMSDGNLKYSIQHQWEKKKKCGQDRLRKGEAEKYAVTV